jgi:uncharacterized damage-inducible protein DinB
MEVRMAIADRMLAEFDHEMGTTRRALERVPNSSLGWRPHPKSMSMARLATHLAELPGWAHTILEQDGLDLTGPYTPREESAISDVLAKFDEGVARMRAALGTKTDAELMVPWTLKREGKALFTMPKAAMLRSMFFNHMVHHRGQMSVYLRLNDIPVPSMYGPSADEGRV